MLRHHHAELVARPVAAVEGAQEIRNLVAVRVPASDGFACGGVVTGLGCGEDLRGDQDVLAQQRRQLVASFRMPS
jgi:hypothetical protein